MVLKNKGNVWQYLDADSNVRSKNKKKERKPRGNFYTHVSRSGQPDMQFMGQQRNNRFLMMLNTLLDVSIKRFKLQWTQIRQLGLGLSGLQIKPNVLQTRHNSSTLQLFLVLSILHQMPLSNGRFMEVCLCMCKYISVLTIRLMFITHCHCEHLNF